MNDEYKCCELSGTPHDHIGMSQMEEGKPWWEERPFNTTPFVTHGEEREYDIPLILSTHRAKVIEEVREIVEGERQSGEDGKREWYNGYENCAISILSSLSSLIEKGAEK